MDRAELSSAEWQGGRGLFVRQPLISTVLVRLRSPVAIESFVWGCGAGAEQVDEGGVGGALDGRRRQLHVQDSIPHAREAVRLARGVTRTESST